MPPKKTPYQFKKGLTYVKQVPRFLQGITSQANNYDDSGDDKDIDDKESSDNEFNATREEERPQIVVLKEGKHMSEREVKAYLDSRDKEKDEKNDASDANDDTPVVDEKTGKILFRKPKTKKPFTSKTPSSEIVVGSHSSKPKNESHMPIKAINEVIDGMKRKRDNEIENVKSEKKPKKTKQKMISHLSFNDDEI